MSSAPARAALVRLRDAAPAGSTHRRYAEIHLEKVELQRLQKTIAALVAEDPRPAFCSLNAQLTAVRKDLSRLDNLRERIRCWEQAVSVWPFEVGAWFDLSHAQWSLYAMTNDVKVAEACMRSLRYARALFPDPLYYAYTGKCYVVAFKRPADALGELNEAIRLSRLGKDAGRLALSCLWKVSACLQLGQESEARDAAQLLSGPGRRAIARSSYQQALGCLAEDKRAVFRRLVPVPPR